MYGKNALIIGIFVDLFGVYSCEKLVCFANPSEKGASVSQY